MKSILCASIGVLAGAGAAMGQISPEGPFTGAFSEGFENTGNTGFLHCVVNRVFSNNGDLCTFNPGSNTPSSGVTIASGWGFNCSIGPHSGGRFMGSAGGYVEYLFDTTVSRFGGYFGSNGNNNISSGATMTFFDAGGGTIASELMTLTTCGVWEWHGWTSTTPIKKIWVQGNGSGYGGGFVDMDDMQIDLGGGPPVCYANCDGSTTPPVLNVQDFSCFLGKFASGDAYANCDGSTTPPVLNVQDFSCFLGKFAAGCSAP
jgi:hypothetical protein